MRAFLRIPGSLLHLREILFGEGLRSQLTRALVGVGLLQLLKMVLYLIVSIVLARTLGVRDYGTYAYLFSIIMLLALPTYAGLSPLLVREVAFYDRGGQSGLLNGIYRHSTRFSAAVAAVVILGVFAYCVLHGDDDAIQPWILPVGAAAAIPLIAFTQVRSAVLQGLRRVVSAKVPDMAVRPMILCGAVGALACIRSLSIGTAILGQIISIAAAFLVAHFLLARSLPRPAGGVEYDSRRWNRAFIPFSAIALTNYLNTELFVPLVGALSSATEVAYFRISMSIAILIGIPLVLVESVIHPHIARLYSERDVRKIMRLVTGSGVIALLLSLPVIAVLLLFGEDILLAAYGAQYRGAAMPLLILSIGYAGVNLVGPSMQLLYATEFENDALVISLVSLVLVGLMSVAWIPSHGAVGAAAAFSIARVSRALAFRLWARRRLALVSRRRPI